MQVFPEIQLAARATAEPGSFCMMPTREEEPVFGLLVEPSKLNVGRKADFLRLGPNSFRTFRADIEAIAPPHLLFTCAVADWTEELATARMATQHFKPGSLLLVDGRVGVLGSHRAEGGDWLLAFDIRTGEQFSKGGRDAIVIQRWRILAPKLNGEAQSLWEVDVSKAR